MTSIVKWAKALIRRKPLAPVNFPSSGYKLIPESQLVEEEHFDTFGAGRFYPVRIGDVYHAKYQVLGKLGFGTTSTVWLARNLQ